MILPQDIQENLPLTETMYYILLSLANEPRHGYRIMKDVEQLSEARVKFSTGTLYGALKRLLERRWIERLTVDDLDPPLDERNRKSYALTHLGKQVLEAEIHRLRKLVQLAGLRNWEMQL
jgi:DNA-binding PadR family transcriptional regulator